jgi:hypothetical protein
MDVLNSVEIDFNSPQKTQNGCLNFGDFEINYRYIKGVSDSVIVAFDGWDPEKDYDLIPTYRKWRYFKSLGGSCLYFSHPVYKKVKVSHSIYSAICRFINIENVIFKLIKLMVNENKFRSKDVIFYGGSSGGFAAIQYSLLFSRSKCCVINPETSITAHEGHLINKYINLVIKNDEGNSIREVSSLNLSSVLVKKSILPHLFVYQNFQDETYYYRHFIPFTEMYRARSSETQSGSLTISEFSDNNGHSANISNIRLCAALGMLQVTMNRSKGVSVCHSRLLYRRMSDLELKVSFYIKLDAIEGRLLKEINMVFCKHIQDIGTDKSIKKVPLSFLSKTVHAGQCTYLWNGCLPVDAQYVFLVSGDCDLSSSVIKVKEFINLDTIKNKYLQ